MHELLNDRDYQLLEKLRLEHFRAAIPELPLVTLHLDQDYVLHLHCVDSEQAETLEALRDRITETAYFVLGCQQINVWLDSEMIWQFSGDYSGWLAKELESIQLEICELIEETTMTTAVLDHPIQAAAPASRSPKVAPALGTFDDVVKAVAKITSQPANIIGNLVLKAAPSDTWQYADGKFMLPPSAITDTLSLLKAQIEAAIAGYSPAAMVEAIASTNGATAEPQIETPAPKTRPAAKRTATAKKTGAKKPAARTTTKAKQTAS